MVDEVPYVIALVELAEGPRLTTNVIGCAPEDVHIGLAVEVDFLDLDDDVCLPVFRAATGVVRSSVDARYNSWQPASRALDH